MKRFALVALAVLLTGCAHRGELVRSETEALLLVGPGAHVVQSSVVKIGPHRWLYMVEIEK